MLAAAAHPAAQAPISAAASVGARDLEEEWSRWSGMGTILAWVVGTVVYIVEYVASESCCRNQFDILTA